MPETVLNWAYFGDSNVCAVDWNETAKSAYPTVLKYMGIVADEIVHFMEFLSAHGMNINQSAIAGHSLGAHVAGLVGARFHGKIDAIYGTFVEFISICHSNAKFKCPYVRLSEVNELLIFLPNVDF